MTFKLASFENVIESVLNRKELNPKKGPMKKATIFKTIKEAKRDLKYHFTVLILVNLFLGLCASSLRNILS